MKKFSASFFLSLLFLLSACEGFFPFGSSCEHIDNNNDDICDLCDESLLNPVPPSPNPDKPDAPIAPEFPDAPLAPNCAHEDKDNNGNCDKCTGAVLAEFDFFAINDLHGKFTDTDTQPGVDELSTYLTKQKQENENSVFLSSGDMWQGGAESNLTKGLIVTDWMSEMNFTAMTLGNHEYDWGSEYIKNNADVAEFPFLAINVYDRTTNERVDYCAPSVTVEQNGVTIGIIGAIGDCYSSISADKVTDVYFKTGSELTKLVKAESERLRAEGADLIVYSLHDGLGRSYSTVPTLSSSQISSYYDISLSSGYVDLVFEAHTHQNYVFKDANGVYHLQGGGENKGISHAEVMINFANGNTAVNNAELVKTSVYENYDDHPVVDELLDKYEEQIAIAGKVLGRNDSYKSDSALEQLVAQLYYEAGMKKWGEQYDIVLGGAFLRTRSPYNLAAGQVTYGDLQSLFPFDNQIVLCSIRGSDLMNKFFALPADYSIAYGTYGESVKNAIDYTKTYYVVTDTYTSNYSWNNLTEVARYDETTFARDLLADYIEAGGMGLGLGDIITSSIPEILAEGSKLSENEQTTKSYYVKGKIINVENTTYGNMTIEDEEGNQLYIYGVYDLNGNRYDKMTDQPKAGDTVTLYGPIKNYYSKIELINATLVIKE